MTGSSGGGTGWTRGLAIGGSAVALLAAIAQFAAVEGPWPYVLIGAAALALLGSVLSRPAASAAKPARISEAQENVDQLRSEIEKHKRLERELTMAKQTAEAAMMSKGEFLATMSHEIRTPLNGIIPLLDLLLSSPMQPDQREHVQTAFGSAKQLLRIVDDILDYSKLEANKLELETVGVNLKDVLEGVLRLMENAAHNKGLRLALTIDPAVRLAVRGDPVRLRQVLTNLVSNAIKFTERGNVTINVTRRAETRTQHELRFEVRDSGVGISPDAAAKLFQPFSQADTSTTRTYGGTGLGLVICKRIVDLMGGQIGVESTPGRGSLFWFQVPMLKALGDIGMRRRDINGARVLLTTSNPAQQRRFNLALPSWGAMPVHASNTQDAIAKLRAASGRSSSWSFDLLLVDASSIPSTLLALHRGVLREAALEDLRMVYLRGDDDLPPEIADSDRVTVLERDSLDSELRAQILHALQNEPKIVVAPEPVARIPALPPDAPLRGTVLLVEDNPVNRQVAQRLLSLAGLNVEPVENGKEAVDRIATTRYDAVLMDCQMPVMDGYTATRQIRANEAQGHLPRLPIIAMTANAMVGDREKCLAAGMDDYLSKPLNRGLMEETLRRWLPATPVGETGAAPAVAHAAPPARPPRSVSAPVRAADPMATHDPSLTAAELIAAIPSGAVRHAGPREPVPASAPPLAPAAQSRPHLFPPSARPGAPSVAPTGPVRAPIAAPTAAPRPAFPARSAHAAPAIAHPASVAASHAPAQFTGHEPSYAPPMARPAAQQAPAAGPVLNREIVDDLREIMGEEFVALVRVFLEDAPHSLHKLEAAAAKVDIDGLVGPAHSLKSTSANLGALALSDIARTIEHGARQRTLTDPAAHVAALGREFHRVDAALRGFLG